MEPCEPTIFDPNFNFNSTPAPNVTAIDAKQAADLVQKVACVDVRTEEEFGRGHLRGAINVPMLAAGPDGSRQVNQQFLEQTSHAVADKDAQILVYCQAGKRGALATKALQDAGYSCVLNLAGGLTAWTDAGLPVMQ